jgi:hypothetical protein
MLNGMKKLIILLMLIAVAAVSMAADADRSFVIKPGQNQIFRLPVLGDADTIITSQTVTYTIDNRQAYAQNQVFSFDLTAVSGSPSVAITAYGRVTSTSSWVQIGSPITWTSNTQDGDISSTTAINYNYLKVEFVASGATQKVKIASFRVRTSNVVQIPNATGTMTISRPDAGTVTITSADNDANAALTVAAGGTGALTIGDANSTTAITSSDWAISTSGAATGMGAITSDGAITTSGIVTGGFKLLAPVVNTDGSETLTWGQSGQMIVATKSDGATTITLPDPLEAAIGVYYYIVQTADQNLVLTTVTADNNAFVCDGVATSDNVTISTTSHKIGAGMFVVCISETQYYVGGLNPESVLTPEAAD